MIDSILAAVDPSDHGSRVIDYAIHVGCIFGSRIVGVSVVEAKKIEGPILRDYLDTVGLAPDMDYATKVETFYREKLTALLDQFGARCRDAGLEFEGSLEKGTVHKIVCDRGSSHDLVIMGKMGEHAEWSADQLGASVQYVARSLRTPLLLTPKRQVPISRGVVAFDGSSYSRDALELAVDIGRRTRLRGTVLVVGDGKKRDSLVAEAQAILEKHGAGVEVATRAGEPASAILGYADEVEADLIIMGAYGHGRIHALILGSTTEEVMSRARVPLLLCH